MPGWIAGLGLAAVLAALHGLWVGISASRQAAVHTKQMKTVVGEIIELRREMDDAMGRVSDMSAELDDMPDSKALTAEIKVLQSLLAQLHSAKSKPAAAEKSTSGESAAAVPVPAVEEKAPPIAIYDDDEVLHLVQRALREDSVDLYLQPIVTLPQRKLVHYECFSRISDHKGSVIAPEQYIPIAEETGLVAAIDNLLLFRLVQHVRIVRKDHMDYGFFCNISDASLRDADFFQDFIEFMAVNRQLAENIIFEFTQAVIDSEDLETQLNLQKLAGCGYRFSLDQVSDLNLNLDALAEMRFKFIKVDAHLLHETARGANPKLDMNAFKGALDRHAMDLIVEKIESDEMLRDLLDLRIDFGQGFFFGEPKPSAR